jgi:hypothetical protein
MAQAPACYQDVNDVPDLSYVPENTSVDIDVDDILNLSYVPNTTEDIFLTQAPAPMTVIPGGRTRGNTPFPPGYEILFSISSRGSNLTRYLLLY